VETQSLVEQSRERVRTRLDARERVATAASAVAFVAVATALVWLVPGRGSAGFGVAALLVIAYAAAARVQFEVGFAFAVPTQLVFVPMLFLAPLRLVPLLVALGFFLSKLPEHLRGEWHRDRVGLHLVSAWYAVGPVIVLAAAGSPAPSLGRLPLVAAALAAQFLFDFASSAARGRALGLETGSLLRALGPAWLVDVALTPLGLVLAVASARDERYSFLLGLPLTGLLMYFARERKSRLDHALELSHAYRGTALLLGDMLEADDAYTGEHSQDVVSLVVAVSKRLALDDAARRDAELTALLHDVGKVKVPKEILNKPGALTPEERAIVERHTVDGEKMLERVGGLLGHIGHLVRSCHERWDGAGYPDRLAAEAIPLVSRIVCACDAFSAMTADRPYRRALPLDGAVSELRRCAGTQFDPAVVEALVAVVGERRPPQLATAA
jgi:HD-GYP domain-containing protein (c-di-GMP phosphodiesterase class II)